MLSMSKKLMHKAIKMGNVLHHWASLFNMKILSNEMIELVSIKSRHNMLTEIFPRALMKVDFDSLHPKCRSALEINGG